MVGCSLFIHSRVRREPSASTFPTDLAVGLEVGETDPFTFRVEDGGDELFTREFLVGPLEQRTRQFGHVIGLDVARDTEPEPAVALEVGLDVAQVFASMIL